MLVFVRPNGCATQPNPDIDPGLLRDTQLYLEHRYQGEPASPASREAWDRFYRTYAPRLRRFALRYRLQPAELNDCLQEVWRELLVQLRTFRYDPQRGRFDAWLRTLVRSKATDLVRRSSRHPTESLNGHEEARLPGRDPDPATTYEQQCQQQLVLYALAKLRQRVSASDYRLFQLRWIESWTVAEIASSLNLAPEKVSCRLHRVKQKLRCLVRLCSGNDHPGASEHKVRRAKAFARWPGRKPQCPQADQETRGPASPAAREGYLDHGLLIPGLRSTAALSS